MSNVVLIDVALLTDALEIAGDVDKVFVIGGGQIYKLFMPWATAMELTEVYDAPVADTFFPNFSSADFREIERIENHQYQPKFDYVSYRRV